MDYFILRDEETGKIEKIARYREDGIAEKLLCGKWVRDRVLDRQMFDGWLEKISETEAKEIISMQSEQEEVAA